MQTCSYCGKENNGGLKACGSCGTPMTTESDDVEAGDDYPAEEPRRHDGRKRMVRGLAWLLGGAAVSLGTFVVAAGSPGGGHYVVAYGAILFGIAQFLHGWAAARGDRNQHAQELLEEAAELESVDREEAVRLYAEIAVRFPGTGASNEAQRNIRMLTTYKDDV